MQKTKPPAKQQSFDPLSPDGIDRRTWQRFSKGQMTIDGTLDLHGMRQAEAHSALQRFILSHQARGSRKLLIITGKGTRSEEAGILKAKLPQWLGLADLKPYILKISSAQPKHGGSGAFYILLRREKNKS